VVPPAPAAYYPERYVAEVVMTETLDTAGRAEGLLIKINLLKADSRASI